MLFHLTWTRRESAANADAQVLATLDKLEIPADMTIHAWVQRTDGMGGFGLIESDNAESLAVGPLLFAPMFEYEMHLVLQHEDSVALLAKAVEARGG